LLGDRAAAEDAIQETFLRVQRHLDRAPDAGEALIWVYRIATNYCLNEIRDRKLRPRSEADPPEPVAAGPAVGAAIDVSTQVAVVVESSLPVALLRRDGEATAVALPALWLGLQ
jgi:DNA-directed RNA polymerase specialized sigma24 family protein